jgi:hypothetical protein
MFRVPEDEAAGLLDAYLVAAVAQTVAHSQESLL